MIRIYAVSIFCLITFFGCKPKSVNPGFKVTDSGMEFKIHALGDETDPLLSGQYVYLSLTLFDSNGILISSNQGSEYDTAYQYKPLKDGSLMEALSYLVVGDSATFYIDKSQVESYFKNIDLTQKHYFLNMKVIDCLQFEDYQLNKKYKGLTDVFPSETQPIYQFIKQYEAKDVISVGDMFYILLKEGNKIHPVKNDKVVVDYEAFFVNGEKFDSTFDRDHSFEYTVGESGQVLLGFDIGVRQMCEGSEALFILPAHLAFNTRGSTDGTVPPNTTVIYKVKLNSIQHEVI